MEESTVAAAKSAGPAAVNGMIWSPYLVPMQPVIAEFSKQTNITIGAVQDISIFDAPQRAMAEALSRSPQFDFIHIDSNMIPSLASAGYLEPLDEYMKKANFKLDAVARLRQLHDLWRPYLRHSDRRQRAYPIRAQGSD